MAAAKTKTTGNIKAFKAKPKVKRKGVHSKCKSSNSKNAANYTKKYRGQG